MANKQLNVQQCCWRTQEVAYKTQGVRDWELVVGMSGPSLYLDLCPEGLRELMLGRVSACRDRQRSLGAQGRCHRGRVHILRQLTLVSESVHHCAILSQLSRSGYVDIITEDRHCSLYFPLFIRRAAVNRANRLNQILNIIYI